MTLSGRLRTLPKDVQDTAARQLIRLFDEEPEPGDREAIEHGRRDFAKRDFVKLDQ